jgi:hypothetical protein
LNDWLTLLAIVLGPVSAVGITLFFEKSRRTKERRLQILRMLLATRHMPADAQYNVAINLIPAEFNDQADVIAAWRAYYALVRERPDAHDHERRTNVAQAALIYQVMRSVGLKLSEGDIQTEAYVSQGFLDRDNLYLASLKAMPEIAVAMKAQLKNSDSMLNLLANAKRDPGSAAVEVDDGKR